MKYKSKLYSIVLVLFLCTCHKENPQPAAVIGSDFQVYVDRFIAEGASRGFKIDDSQLTVVYSDTLNYYCGYGDHNSRKVMISVRSSCWQTQSDLNKEILMFHELGHALLGRVHDNTTLPNGDYKTMMFGGNQFNIYTLDTPEKRKYYLDELFNPATPPPSWSAAKTIPTIIFKDTINAASNPWVYAKTPGSYQQGELSTSVFLSPSSSLELKSAAPSALSYWYYAFRPVGINQSDKLVLTVHIKTQNLTEGGVYFAVKGDSETSNNFFDTTQGATKIEGTSDFTEYQVTVPYFIATTKNIYVMLMLDGRATGTANFDDITLTKI